MKFAKLVFILVFAFSSFSRAFESDQFTLPETELTDVGPLLSTWIYAGLKTAVSKAKPSSTPDDIIQDLLYELSHCKVGRTTFQFSQTAGFCISRHIEMSLLVNAVKNAPTLYLPSPSIYTKESAPGLFGFFLQDGFRDSDYFWRAFSANSKLYGVIVGLDKIGHFLKLGRDYYIEFKKRVAKGELPIVAAEEVAKAIGVWHELHFYGRIASGIYSNADLATNFAGLGFYRRIFEGFPALNLQPVVIYDGRRWILSQDVRPSDLLKPFISEHMNEAFNPSWFTDHHAPLIRNEIAKRCARWKEVYPAKTANDFNEMSVNLRQWHGLNYGHREQPGGAFTIGRVCNFDL